MSTSLLKIVILMENSTRHARFVAEHGVSFWIEHPAGNFLFDTGQSSLLLKNTEICGIDPGGLKGIIISHGHYDHTGGLEAVLSRHGDLPVYAHPEIFRNRFSRRDGSGTYIGIPQPKERYQQLGARFHFNREPTPLFDGVWLSGEIPRRNNFETVEERFQVKTNGDWVPDEIPDDQALVMKTAGGLVVVTGCGHSGIVNTVEYAREITGMSRVAAVIGGMHLIHASAKRQEQTIGRLEEMGVRSFVPLHCTGAEMRCRLWQKFSNRVKLLGVGDQIIYEI